MPFDPSATRSGFISSSNPVYQAAWICYINGVEVPIMGFNIQYGVWQIPSFSIDLVPDILLQRLGNEDRVPVQIFYLDYWCSPANPEFRLLIDGEIVSWQYASSAGQRTMTFNCLAHIHVFQQLYFFYMTNVDDIVAAQDPVHSAGGFTQSGLLYPYSLFHQGLLVTPDQVVDARPTPRRAPNTTAPARPDTSDDDRVQPPIKAPYELIYNVIKGVISKDVPANRRAIPMMNFFARHIRKTRLHNRFVRLPYLEDPEELANKKGVFPIFQAARNESALNAMQRQVATQIGNSGPVWDVLQQVYSMVYMEIAMIPNPAAVIVSLNPATVTTDNVTTNEPQDGKIIGILSSNLPITQRRTDAQIYADNVLTTQATALAQEIISAIRAGRVPATDILTEAGFLIIPTNEAQVDITQIRTTLERRRGLRAPLPGQAPDYAVPVDEGTNPETPIRLAQYFVKPQFFFGIPPHCNVIFPSMVDSWTYDEPYLSQPTRLYVNDSVMTQLLRATGSNREFMLHALTVAFPEEANAVLEHKVGGTASSAQARNAMPAMSESGKNLLIWPEEFYKGPVTAKLALPSWFQTLRQFSNGSSNPDTPPNPAGTLDTTAPGGGVNGATNGDKASALLGGAVEDVTPGRGFGFIRGPKYHAGTDFFTNANTPVYSIFAGKVKYLYQNFQAAGAGNMLVLEHPGRGPSGETVWCVYMHLAAFGPGIAVGGAVTAGQLVGYVGNRNGTRQLQRDVVREFHIPPEIVTQAENAPDRDACVALLQSYFAGNKVPPRGTNTRAWPWNRYQTGDWRALAHAVGGFFVDTPVTPHVHFEVIVSRRGIRNPFVPPTLVNGRPTPDNRLDPVAWLRSIGVNVGTNVSIPGSRILRRGRNNDIHRTAPSPGARTETDDQITGINLPEQPAQQGEVPAPQPGDVPASGVPPQVNVTTHASGVALPGTSAAGTPAAVHTATAGRPATRPEPSSWFDGVATGLTRVGDRITGFLEQAGLAYVGEAPVNTASRDRVAPPTAPTTTTGTAGTTGTTGGQQATNQTGPAVDATFQELFKLYAQYEYLKRRYMVRQAAVQMRFNPYLVPGFPSMMFDSLRTRFHIAGYVQYISHTASAGNGGSMATRVQLTCCRTLPEFINDVLSDSLRFTARVQAAPAEVIETIRLRIQDEDNAEQFYQRLLYGDTRRTNNMPAAFRWTEAVGYTDAEEVQAIYTRGASVADAAAQDAAYGIAPGSPVNVSTGESINAAPTAPELPTRQIETNIDPTKELSPRENIYQEAFDSYDVAMNISSRPVCTLEQFIRFWHAGKTLNDLQLETPNRLPDVVGPQELFSYTRLQANDVVAEGTTPGGVRTNIRGTAERTSAVYFDRIFRLRIGPGPDLPGEPPGNHLKPPSDPEQGYTSPTDSSNTIAPTIEHVGVARDYPQTRADWDTVLEQYRDKVRLILRPNT